MAVVSVGIGVGLVALALFDIFETLLDPEDQGRITGWISWLVWQICRMAPHPSLSYAGPLAYLAVLGTWASLMVIGGGFIYWPFLPDAFAFDSGLDQQHRSGFVTALYLSLVTFATLGYGDISPTEGWLRIVGPAQSLVGFFLLSAAITWILAIYQDIETRRTLAHETTLLKEALESEGLHLHDLPSGSIEQLVEQVTSRFVSVTGSLNQFPITYYFRISDDRQSLAVMALFLSDLSEELSHEASPPEIRLRARMLAGALEHFAEALQRRFLDVGEGAGTRTVLEAYARDHLRTGDAV